MLLIIYLSLFWLSGVLRMKLTGGGTFSEHLCRWWGSAALTCCSGMFFYLSKSSGGFGFVNLFCMFWIHVFYPISIVKTLLTILNFFFSLKKNLSRIRQPNRPQRPQQSHCIGRQWWQCGKRRRLRKSWRRKRLRRCRRRWCCCCPLCSRLLLLGARQSAGLDDGGERRRKPNQRWRAVDCRGSWWWHFRSRRKWHSA